MRRVPLACLLLFACTEPEGREDLTPRDGGTLTDGGTRTGAGTRTDAGIRADAGIGTDSGNLTDAYAPRPYSARDAAQERALADATLSPAPSTEDCRAFVPEPDCADGVELPSELRCTGLYADWSTRELACGVAAYTPAFQLWSDGAEKSRYVSIPAGAKIDASDPNSFVYPVGTQFWKEFRLSTPRGQRPGETRLLRKTERGWSYTSYVWSDDGRRAVRSDVGKSNLFGTSHDVPTQEQCKQCHAGRPDFVLGWDWLMLGPGSSGLTRDQLHDWIDADAPTEVVPGDETERAALGYLHANCGVSCHNDTANAEAHEIGLFMRLEISELASVQTSDVFRTGINRVPNWWSTAFIWAEPVGGTMYDFRPGDRTRSYALARMNVRGKDRQMPLIGTDRVDPVGARIIESWIEQMTPARGYPEAGP